MGRFDLKYSDQQREAIGRAMAERGMSAPETVKAAAAGLDDLKPFEIPKSTARDIASEWRRRQGPAHGPLEDQLRGFQDRGLDLFDQELTKAEETLKRGGQLTNSDLTRLTKLTRFARALGELHPTQPSPEPQATEDQGPTVLESLKAALEQQGTNGNGDESHEPSLGGGSRLLG